MPLSVCTVSGVLYDATGAAMALETLLIRPRNWVAGSDGIVMPETITEVTDTSGNISVNLTQGIYTVETTRPNLVGRKTFVISVPNAASADIEAIADFTGQSKQAAFLDGTVSLPGFRFQNDLDTGFWLKGANAWGFSAGGVERLDITTTGINATVPFGAANGTAGAPTFSFTSDPDTGMYRVGANQLGFSVGASLIATISSAGMALTGLLSGTAVTQTSTDTTTGRLLKVGDFGLGAATAPTVTLNTAITQGLFNYANGDANNPSGGLGGGTVLVLAAAPFVVQIARRNNGYDMFTRWSGDSGVTWAAWSRIYGQRSSIGTVSESSGIPTGALIERGSNANGEFTRFADGTQLCYHSLASSSSADTTWTYPAVFSVAPVVTLAVANGSGPVPTIANLSGAPTTTTVGFNNFNLAGARQVFTTRLLAIGRWF